MTPRFLFFFFFFKYDYEQEPNLASAISVFHDGLHFMLLDTQVRQCGKMEQVHRAGDKHLLRDISWQKHVWLDFFSHRNDSLYFNQYLIWFTVFLNNHTYFKYFKNHTYVYIMMMMMYVWVCAHECRNFGFTRAVVNHLWVLGTELRSSTRGGHALNLGAISPAYRIF